MTASIQDRNSIRQHHNVSVWNLLPRRCKVAYPNQSQTPSILVPFGEEQSPALSPSVGAVADRPSTNDSSWVRSDTGAPERTSRTTASTAQNTSSDEQTPSEQSSRRALTRGARKPITTSRTNVSRSRQSFWRSLAGGLSNSRTGK